MFRCLAGLLPIDDGRIELDGACLDDPAADVFVPPERRPVGVVFQDYLLFANLTALENVAFGLRARGVAKSEARARGRGVAGAGRARPTTPATGRAQLSGGQAQRVALARALATEPRLLLLDEPLAALDAGTRGDVRRDLRRHLATFDGVRLLVTHDPVDAYALADRVVILEAGRVVQTGTLAEVTARPRSRYIADLVGVNLLAGDRATTASSPRPTGGRIVPADSVDGPAFAVIQPHAVALYREPARTAAPATSGRSPSPTSTATPTASASASTAPSPLVAEITPAALDALVLRPGDRIWATVKATEITTYPA